MRRIWLIAAALAAFGAPAVADVTRGVDGSHATYAQELLEHPLVVEDATYAFARGFFVSHPASPRDAA